MSEYSELIEDLLVNGLGYGFQVADLTQRAAKALKAQAKEIAELKEQLAEANAANLTFGNQSARIAELEASNAELSVRCQAMFSLLPDETKLGDIQKAAARLKGDKSEQP